MVSSAEGGPWDLAVKVVDVGGKSVVVVHGAQELFDAVMFAIASNPAATCHVSAVREIQLDGEPTRLPPPTLPFLEEVRERARRYGWGGDYTELADWVRALYREAGAPVPDLEPYPVDDDEN